MFFRKKPLKGNSIEDTKLNVASSSFPLKRLVKYCSDKFVLKPMSWS